MVDSWRSLLEVEIFWPKFALMDTRETSVFCDPGAFRETHYFHVCSWGREECPVVR